METIKFNHCDTLEGSILLGTKPFESVDLVEALGREDLVPYLEENTKGNLCLKTLCTQIMNDKKGMMFAVACGYIIAQSSPLMMFKCLMHLQQFEVDTLSGSLEMGFKEASEEFGEDVATIGTLINFGILIFYLNSIPK